MGQRPIVIWATARKIKKNTEHGTRNIRGSVVVTPPPIFSQKYNGVSPQTPQGSRPLTLRRSAGTRRLAEGAIDIAPLR
jgi:hypothetical protein